MVMKVARANWKTVVLEHQPNPKLLNVFSSRSMRTDLGNMRLLVQEGFGEFLLLKVDNDLICVLKTLSGAILKTD